jgi:chorismate-pyruvate lyase
MDHEEDSTTTLRPGAFATRARALAAGVGLAALGGCVALSSHDEERLRRAEALALLQTLNADLLGHDSATATLERWCSDHRLAEPARIVAHRIRTGSRPLPDELRTRLALDPGETIGYRRVQLACGERVLSEADNWYVPARLTAEMNRTLDATDEPFGKVVRALGFRRQTLSAQLLWSPLPPGWELGAGPVPAAPLRVPAAVLRHVAILFDERQRPFSAVVETYTNRLFDFGVFSASIAPP